MNGIQERIHEISDAIKALREEEFSLYREVSKNFNEKKTHLTYPSIIKYTKKNNSTLYFVLKSETDIESRSWKTHTGILHSVSIRGLYILRKDSGELVLQSEGLVTDDDFFFNFFNDMAFISEDEFKTIIEEWYGDSNTFYMTPDEDYEPIPDWFVEFGYKRYFEGYEKFLPKNETI
jgi:hypothetical protein